MWEKTPPKAIFLRRILGARIVALSEFRSLYDERIELNKRVFESLIKSGAMDTIKHPLA